MSTTTARNLRPGQRIDLARTARTFDPYADEPGRDHWQYEYAEVIETSREAVSAEGVPAVLIYTDQGSYKVPAGWELENA